MILWLWAVPGAAYAQSADYPSRPIRMVVPFGPGGASDFIARIIQPKFADMLGQQVVIDNRSGADGRIGVEVAARAGPDGHTILLGNVGSVAINPSVYPKFPVRPLRDFAWKQPMAFGHVAQNELVRAGGEQLTLRDRIGE